MNLQKKFSFYFCLSLLFQFCAFALNPGYAQNRNRCKLSNHNNEFVSLSYVFSKESKQGEKEFFVGWDASSPQSLVPRNKPEVGGEILVLRCLPPGRWEYIAQGSVDQMNGTSIEASVSPIAQDDLEGMPSYMNRIVKGNRVWTPMVGDIVIPKEKVVERVKHIYPNFPLDNGEIFIKLAENDGYSFDLSEHGKERLKQHFQQHFLGANGRLLVEGFISQTTQVLQNGGKSLRENLRVESLLRAQAVATFLELEFQLQPNQIVSFGLGDDLRKVGMQSMQPWPKSDLEQGIIMRLVN